MSLLARLLLLVTVALLPAIGIEAYSVFEFRQELLDRARSDVLQLSRLQAADLSRIVGEAREFTTALTELQSVRLRDTALCSPYMRRLLPHYPQYVLVDIADRDGRVFCTSRVDEDANIADRPIFREAMESGDFATGVFTTRRGNGQRVLPFAMPSRDQAGAINGVVTVSLDLDWLAGHIGQKLPPHGNILIADRNGLILARQPENEHWVGKPIRNPWILEERQEGTTELIGLDGIRLLVGFQPVAVAPVGLHVATSLEKPTLFAGAEAATRRNVMLAVAAAGLAIAAAWSLGYPFVRGPIDDLLVAIRRWKAGDSAVRVALGGGREINQLKTAFNDMIATISQRESALREAEEKALRHERDFSRLLIESSAEAVLAYDREQRITVWNPAMERLTGYDRAAAAGRAIAELLPLARDPALEAAVQNALEGRRTTLHDRPYEIKQTGRKGVFEADISPLYDQDGRVVGGIAFVRDTTERRELEQAMQRAQRMEAVGQLTGGVAHDFNNLLTVVGGNIDVLVSALPPGSRLLRLAQSAQRGVERGARLTSQLLAFARRQHLRPEIVNVNGLVRENRELLHRAAGETVEIQLVVDPTLWPCRIDPAQFEAALLNLVINAHDAMPSGGKLSIETRNLALRSDAPAAGIDAPPGDYVLVTIADTGTGMPPEVLHRAFEPFFTTKETGKGTGLGLSQVYGFVTQSGGYVGVESEVGVGTTIRICLPRAAAEAAQPGPAAGTARQRPGSGRVLLVEDNPDVLEIAAAMLQELGYRVLTACSGQEALAHLAAGDPVDLLVTDVVMPGISGIQLAEEVAIRWPATRVLLTTGYAESLNALEGGRWQILAKPYRRDALAAKLREMLTA